MKTILIVAASFLGSAVAGDYEVINGPSCAEAKEVSLEDCKALASSDPASHNILNATYCKQFDDMTWRETEGVSVGCLFDVSGDDTCVVYYFSGPSVFAEKSHAQRPVICHQVALPSANQDPHITNALGHHFELRQDGRYNMLSVSHKEVSEFKLFADLFRIDQKACAPAYIRTLTIVTGQTTLSIRRGIPNNFSATTISDEINVQMADQEWIPHSSLSQQHSIGDLKVEFGGSVDCRDTVHDRHDCKHVVVVSPHVQVRVEGGQSPNSERHFLNLQIVKLDTSEATVSGVLWEDNHDQHAHC